MKKTGRWSRPSFPRPHRRSSGSPAMPQARRDLVFPRWLPWVIIGVVAAALLAGYLLTRQSATAQTDNAALQGDKQALARNLDATAGQALDLASLIAQACSAGTVPTQYQGACTKAAAVQAQPIPGTPGVPGAAGPAGKGISATAIRAGRLVLFFTDGTTADVGQVAGVAGTDGVSITSSLLVGGHLMLTYSDGRTIDVGQVVGQAGPAGATGVAGAAGADGKNGADGRSVTSAANVDGRLIVTFSDGTTQDAGPLPVAVAGRPPSGFSYTGDLGQVHNCTPDTPPDPGSSPHYSCT